MWTVSLIAQPGALPGDIAETLRAAWSGGALRWLASDEAVEFPVGTVPSDLAETAAALRQKSIDLNLLPSANREKRLLIADMDSTMIGQECIDELADAAGVGAEVAAITEQAMRGELDFEAALEARVARLEGLTVQTIEEVLQSRITANPGAATLIATMRQRGASTHLVSGGFTIFTAAVAARLGFDSHHANRLDIRDGRLTGKVDHPILGRDAKQTQLQTLARHYGLALDDTLAIGDGANDLAMIDASGLGLAYRAKPICAERAAGRIDAGDLTAALYLQGIAREAFQSPQ